MPSQDRDRVIQAVVDTVQQGVNLARLSAYLQEMGDCTPDEARVTVEAYIASGMVRSAAYDLVTEIMNFRPTAARVRWKHGG